ncbi:MAG: hypothetical protein DBO98_04770 [Candidatus Liberibacter europaeus]|nr:hypothetical protein [Candidatus Liberibacter europaeus]
MKPSKYTKEKAEAILDLMSTGKSLFQACLQHQIPYRTFRSWLKQDKEGLNESYEEAKRACMEAIAEELHNLVHSEPTAEEKEYPHLLKLRDTRMNHLKWTLEKRHRNVYGTQVKIEQSHTIDLKPLLNQVQKSIETKGLKPVNVISKSTETPLESSNNNLIEHSTIKPIKRT